ncbi:MAG: cytochrome c family protein [Gammaproteobacteria bacterium]|nr:cytochrome c family protein [Gammaproteobacteria bacterium]MDH3374074.1 cytochrome c family protein [Gammaproteobacteria bacterium]
MIRTKRIGWMLAGGLVAACGGGAEPHQSADSEPRGAVLTAETLGDQAVTTASDYLSDPRYASANRRNGATQAQICRACHSLEKGGAVLIGPNLYGIFGKPAGGGKDFTYSDALATAGFVWTPLALDAWLAQPARFLPGNRMTFAGVMNEGDRNDLIAYLLDVTDDSGDD